MLPARGRRGHEPGPGRTAPRGRRQSISRVPTSTRPQPRPRATQLMAPASPRGERRSRGVTVLLARCGRVDGLAQDCYRPLEAGHGLCQLRQTLARLNQTHSPTESTERSKERNACPLMISGLRFGVFVLAEIFFPLGQLPVLVWKERSRTDRPVKSRNIGLSAGAFQTGGAAIPPCVDQERNGPSPKPDTT
jgi:hypothetical protein